MFLHVSTRGIISFEQKLDFFQYLLFYLNYLLNSWLTLLSFLKLLFFHFEHAVSHNLLSLPDILFRQNKS